MSKPLPSIHLFHRLDEGVVIVAISGRYNQVDLYYRGTDLYAHVGKDYIKLTGTGGTSVPNTRWYDIQGPGVTINRLGQPSFANADAVQAIKAAA